ncbi:thiol:disulfide interchange protein DsbC [Comamonas sp. BIGb0124]|uniref:DsbC family protein n=1 Tax=Comamonas sp. BIGb0124 TaxID=2485130 RepID=UPI000F4A85D7|nr:DsbC family protein [Comamonas sp. BIGb0124]ROR17894.1 thiol:disulfide interchange protein DsbC [Comamonas sp. BIGb0124]
MTRSPLFFRLISRLATAALLACAALPALAQEAAIRKALPDRLPSLPAIDEVRTTPWSGLYEVRMGSDVLYTDAGGNFLIQGELLDLKTKANLTQQRIAELSAVDVSKLPLDDAFVTKRGKGERKLVVFADPNCGYCKRFESELAKVDNVTVHTFLYPILGQDSVEKSRNIWCAKSPSQVWDDWMLRGKSIPSASCSGDREAALKRNVAFGQKHKIEGTPTLLFVDGQRVPGAISAAQIESLLVASSKK